MKESKDFVHFTKFLKSRFSWFMYFSTVYSLNICFFKLWLTFDISSILSPLQVSSNSHNLLTSSNKICILSFKSYSSLSVIFSSGISYKTTLLLIMISSKCLTSVSSCFLRISCKISSKFLCFTSLCNRSSSFLFIYSF